jgi:HEAT repeat protein
MSRAALALLTFFLLFAATKPVTEADVRNAGSNVDALKSLGPAALPHLVRAYRTTADEETRASIASTFYALGWKSQEARAALLADIDTANPRLRLQVQWALGRVSDDTQVVEILANIMRTDGNPLFRDKAACALAYDQIHLTERQKVLLYGKLIDALKDEKPQVRSIAILALKIQTGQDKGFDANATNDERIRSIAAWKRWLAEYEKNL